jgi:hypothetical protein
VPGEYIKFLGGKLRAFGNEDASGFIGYPAGQSELWHLSPQQGNQ